MSEETAEVGSNDNIMARLSALQEPAEAPSEPVEAVPAQAVEQAAPVEASAEELEVVPDQPEETDSADNLVDIEFDGKILKGSPEIREAVLRHSDYTRKTTELAEHRALFQKEREISEQQAAFATSIATENTELAQIDAQLAQFKALPWDEFDMQQLVKATHARDALKERKAEIKQSIDEKRETFTKQAVESKNELYREAHKYLTKKIPNFGKQAIDEFVSAAKAVGFVEAEVKNFTDGRAIELAWKAAQWDKLQAAKPIAQKKVSEVPPVVKPGSQATTESKATVQARKLREDFKKSGDVKDLQKLFAYGK